MSQTTQASVSMLNINVHHSTIRETLNKCGLFQAESILQHGSTAGQMRLKVEMLVYNAQQHIWLKLVRSPS